MASNCTSGRLAQLHQKMIVQSIQDILKGEIICLRFRKQMLPNNKSYLQSQRAVEKILGIKKSTTLNLLETLQLWVLGNLQLLSLIEWERRNEKKKFFCRNASQRVRDLRTEEAGMQRRLTKMNEEIGNKKRYLEKLNDNIKEREACSDQLSGATIKKLRALQDKVE